MFCLHFALFWQSLILVNFTKVFTPFLFASTRSRRLASIIQAYNFRICVTAMPPAEDDPYENVAKGSLKLKGVENISKKKKKKEKEKKKLVEVTKIIEDEKPDEPVSSTSTKRTKAELAFKKMQEKMQTERIKQKASLTHKQRVEEFNRHLDSLTEHFDIPKVSWTK